MTHNIKSKFLPILAATLLAFITFFVYFDTSDQSRQNNTEDNSDTSQFITDSKKERGEEKLHPMSIENLRNGEYPGGDFVIEEKLSNGTNYKRYIVSYKSEDFKIYGLLTVPLAERPKGGFPAVIFIHGYIPPKQYSTTSSYPTYPGYLAREGFVVFKPDLRGHGNSEGEAVSAHLSEKYVIDTLNAIEYLKNYVDVNPKKVVYWGHSNGSEIGLRVVTVSSDIKAASFWAGVVGSYEDMFETYNNKISFLRNVKNSDLIIENKLPSENLEFWKKLDPYFHLDDIHTPIQIQHGTKDDSVPIELSQSLKTELEKFNKPVEYYEYEGDNHNISNNVHLAFQRTIDFYNESLLPQVPIDKAQERVTKKPFGIHISPNTSPVQPEKFSGYHTGVDFEIFPEEKDANVEIYTICTGPIVLKKTVSGYGGVIVQECVLEDQDVTVVYGHLKWENISKKLDQNLKKGESLGILGKGFSEETDGERKHLHLGVHKGKSINLRGYVETPDLLDDWIDPMQILQ